MPKIDLSITISALVALAAIISPVLVALINNMHHSKIRRIELEHEMAMKNLTILYEDKKNAFSNFLLNAGKMCTDEQTHDVEQNFYAYTQLAILFASKENQEAISLFSSEMIFYLDKGIPPEKYDYFKKQVSSIATALSKELSILQVKISNNKNCK